MAADIEWGPAPDQQGSPLATAWDASDGELLDAGPARRPPPWMQRLTARARRVPLTLRCVVGAIAVMCAVIAYDAGHPSPTMLAAPSIAGGGSPTDPGMSAIEAKARESVPLLDYVRSDSRRGACPPVALGHSQHRAMVAAMGRALPGYKFRDDARTLDEFGGMCEVDMRAADARGSVLVIEVAPQRASRDTFTALSVASRSDGSTTLTTAAAITPAGWSIRLGTLGPTADQPPSAALLLLAQDPILLW